MSTFETFSHKVSVIDYDIPLGNIEDAVRKEMSGPGRLLGYRALHKKLREIHRINVPRNVVYAMILER